MCGIAGWLGYKGSREGASDLLERMKLAIYHRGPDENGSFVDDRVAIGMQRLAIVDLVGGQQPMANEDDSIWIVFNGEIYNQPYLRPRLEAAGHRFKTNSDTECILHLYEDYGDDCVDHLTGMFAFCIWDTRRGRALLARDRVGKKPLFYAQGAGGLLFASEMKAILCHPMIKRDLDPVAVETYLALGYALPPRTALAAVRQVRPGHVFTWEAHSGAVRETPYWEPHPGTLSDAEARDPVGAFLGLLEDATRSRLLSEVPLGAFLSGGIDSSSVVAMMRGGLDRPVRTFCLGFDEPSWGEQSYARRVAAHLGTDHREGRVPALDRPSATGASARTLADDLPKIIAGLDEPHADTSAIPVWYLCQMTRKHVTVALSGDGGDEALAGYDTYLASAIRPVYALLPQPVRTGITRLAQALPSSGKKLALDELLRRFTAAADGEADRAHYGWRTIFGDDSRARLLGRAPDASAPDPFAEAMALCPNIDAFDGVQRHMYFDIRTWLTGDILVKVDRMSMAHSLEVRSPLLDHRIIEFALRLPASRLLRLSARYGPQTKAILKDSMTDILPRTILHRRKRGFSSPVGSWLGNGAVDASTAPLRALMQDVLARPMDAFDRRVVRDVAEGRSGADGRPVDPLQAWDLLVLHLWHDWARSWRGPEAPGPIVVGTGATPSYGR
jgi:asparagine synthase (glutamine-hydrolysing)